MASMYAESLRAFLKPVLPYLDDPAVSEIMINGPNDIWIETKGKLIRTDATFTEEGLLGAARNMAQFVGRLLTEERPRLDARLPDGSRIHVVLPPIGRKGTTISIRKFFKDKLTIDKLIEFGSMTQAMARFIEGCVIIKENIVVSGGTGSGKTTLLNIVSTLIPNDERILTIEDSAELQLQQDHIVPFESRPPDKFGKGGVDMGDLLHSALRMRPDRIVVGEVRGGEAFHLVQAMNTGHGGSMATTHANTPTDTLRRIESLCLQSGIELPMVAVRAQVASAVNVIVCCERLMDGSRRTTAISEVLPLNDKGEYRTQDIFVFTATHKDSEGRVHGFHAPTGVIPNFIRRLRSYGFDDMTEEFFDPYTYGVPPPPQIHSSGVLTTWVQRLKHRAHGEEDPQEIKEFQARSAEVATKKEEEHKRWVDEVRKKAAAAPKPEPPKAAPALKPAAAEAPKSAAETSAPKPAPGAPARPVSTAPKPAAPPPRPAAKDNIEVSSDLLGEGEGAEASAPSPQAPSAVGHTGAPPRRPVVSAARPGPAVASDSRAGPRPRPAGVMSSRGLARRPAVPAGDDEEPPPEEGSESDADAGARTAIGIDVKKFGR